MRMKEKIQHDLRRHLQTFKNVVGAVAITTVDDYQLGLVNIGIRVKGAKAWASLLVYPKREKTH